MFFEGIVSIGVEQYAGDLLIARFTGFGLKSVLNGEREFIQ